MAVISLGEKVKFIESVFGCGRLSGNSKNMDVWCPICAPKDSSKKKLAILMDDDRNHCWTCGWKARTLAPLIRKFGSREKFQEYINRFVPEAERAKQKAIPMPGDEVLKLPDGFRLLANSNKMIPDVKAAYRYVTENRGLDDSDLWYFKLGIATELRWQRRVIVPSFDAEGDLSYYVARAIDPRTRPKYDQPDVDSNPIVFNEINVDWKKRLVLCEGAFDMFKCGENAVPLLGSDVSESSRLFNQILVNETPVAIALDDDMWETKTIKMAKKFSDYDIDVVIVDTRKIGDPGNATKKEFRDALREAKPNTWLSMFLTRLNRASKTSLVV